MSVMESVAEYVLPEVLSFAEVNGVMIANINSEQAKAEISLQGGQVLSWQPKGAERVIWMSTEAKPTVGKGMRGGVPVCWPWFGSHASEADFPAHGFARSSEWQMVASALLESGEVRLLMQLSGDGSSEWWPHPFKLQLEVLVGTRLQLNLTSTNLSDQSVVIGEALHTYFQISDIEQVSVSGLDGVIYHDKVSGAEGLKQQDEIRFGSETDSVYINSHQSCVIDDAGLQRQIVIEKSGSDSTVVWNPWSGKAERMGDLGELGWRKMLCVESANAFDNLVTLAAGESHSLKVVYRLA